MASSHELLTQYLIEHPEDADGNNEDGIDKDVTHSWFQGMVENGYLSQEGHDDACKRHAEWEAQEEGEHTMNQIVCPVCGSDSYIEQNGINFIDGKVHVKFYCWCDASFSWAFTSGDGWVKADVVLDPHTLFCLYLRQHPEEHQHVDLTNVNGVPQQTYSSELCERQMLWSLEQGYISQEQYDHALENEY